MNGYRVSFSDEFLVNHMPLSGTKLEFTFLWLMASSFEVADRIAEINHSNARLL